MKTYDMTARDGGQDYGLHLSLNDDSLNKLGLKNCQPGDKYRVEGEAKVVSIAQNATENENGRRVELSLHQLGAEPKARPGPRPRSVREDLEDAYHRARGTTAPGTGRNGGRIGARRKT